jgi:hypothetical protein
MQRKAFLALVVACCLTVTAYANPTITAGNWKLLPGTSGQTVDAVSGLPIVVLVSGGDAIAGADLGMTIGDGFTGPVFDDNPDLIVGTIFTGNNTGQNSFFPIPPSAGYAFETTTTNSGTVAANGILAHLSFDTTGFTSGTWVLQLSENAITGLPSDLPPFTSPVLIEGSITIVPEPGTIVLALFAAGGLCAVAIRRRRGKTA